MSPQPSIFVFFALACEAKPLVQHWRLKYMPAHPFQIYKDDVRVVTVTGVGKVAMASAVAYTLAMFKCPQLPVLVNIGIGGHLSHTLGSLHPVVKVVDDETGKTFYPHCIPNQTFAGMAVKTLAKPNSSYDDDYIFDMEAAGFYETAIKFSCLELIHSFKIISDNAESSWKNISQQLVSDWVMQHTADFIEAIEQLYQRRETLTFPKIDPLYQHLKQNYHLSTSNDIKLKKLLARRQLITTNNKWEPSSSMPSSITELFQLLEQEMDDMDFYL